MADIELATASWSGFYDNDPWLNQENWQRYFANTVVDGTPSSDIYNGNWRGNLAPYLDNNGNLIIDSGICFAKGIAARFASSTNVGNSTEDTIFVSVIVDPETRTAKMMSYNVGSSAVTQLLTNPRYFCQSDYEIPICYRDSGRVIDLRHFATDRNSRSNAGLESIVFQTSTSPAVTQYPFGKAYGFEGTRNAFIRAYLGRTYTVTMESGASIDTLRIMPIPVCSSEPATFTINNNTANDVVIILGTDNGYYLNEWVWSTSWTADLPDLKKTLASNSSMTFVLTPAGLDEHKVLYAISSPSTSEGGAIDPETIYTKSEVNSLIEGKADDTDVVSLQNAVEGKAEAEDLAPVWESGEVYQTGDLVTRNSRLYRFLRDFTGFEWDSTAVEAVTIAEHLNDEITVKADADAVYTKTETDALISSQLATKADADSVYTKAEVDAALAVQPPSVLYVDGTSGSDSNDGKTIQTAFKTVQKAVDMAEAPTTRILITPNEYSEFITVSGKNITFAGTTNAEIRFTTSTSYQYTLKVMDGADVRLDGVFTISAVTDAVDISNASLNYKGLTGTDRLRVVCIGSNPGKGIKIENGGILSSSDTNSLIQVDTSGTTGFPDYSIYAVNSHVSIARMLSQTLHSGGALKAIYAESSVVTCNVLEGNQDVSSSSSYVSVNNSVVNDEYYKKPEVDAIVDDYYNKSETGELIDSKIDSAIDELPETYYNKTETINLIDSKIDEAIDENNSPTTFYVDYLSGSDDNDGLTRETAFKTYSKAISACPENFASKINVVAYPAGTRNSEFKIDVSEKKITFKGYMNDKIYTSGIYAHNNAYLRFESEVKVECTGNCVLAERNSYIDFVPTGYLLPDVKINIVGIATQYDAGYPYSYNNRIIAATYGSTIIIPGTVEAGVVVSGSGSSYQEGHATNNAVDADTGSNIYIGNLNIKGYSDHTIFECSGSTIMYGSLTKSGGTTKIVSNGGVVRTGSAG